MKHPARPERARLSVPTGRRGCRLSVGHAGRVLLALLVMAILANLVPPTAGRSAAIVVLRPIDTGWTTTRQPHTAHRSTAYLSATRRQDRSFLAFEGKSLAAHKIMSVSLDLHVDYTTATRPGVVVHPASTDWSSSSLTDANRPPTDPKVVSQSEPTATTGSTLSVPLSTDAIAPGRFAFEISYAQPYIRLALARWGSNGPALSVTIESTRKTSDGRTDVPTIFAHYFPPYPLSLDNQPASSDYYAREYLTPDGEGGIHRAYGGLLRDRPEPVPRQTGDWRLADLRTEVRQAKNAHIDGFMVDVLSPSGPNWDAVVNLMQAASDVGGFVVVPMIDATTSFAQLQPQRAAAELATLYSYPSAYRAANGYLLSSFAAERIPVSWWRAVIHNLGTRFELPISFQAVFLSANPVNMAAFAPIADGFGSWGTRTVNSVAAAPDYAARAHALGKTWMAPVAPQDVRPRSYVYAESDNTQALRAMWVNAIEDHADAVQLVTWNDYSESTQFAPSEAHGSCYLDLSQYYIDWFRRGHPPTITTDQVYVTHRIQRADAKVMYPQQLMRPNLGGDRTQPRDAVEVLTFLTQKATVTVDVGDRRTEYVAPAGVHAETVPLRVGMVSATVARDGSTALTVHSRQPVVESPAVQDLQYYADCALG